MVFFKICCKGTKKISYMQQKNDFFTYYQINITIDAKSRKIWNISIHKSPQSSTAAAEMMGDCSFRQAGGQGLADIFLFAVEQIGVRFIPASFRAPHMLAFRLQPRHRLPCPLADEVPLYLCREPERKSQHFALYIIPQAIAVFDRPYPTSATHAEAQYLHDHVEVSTQPTQLATYDQIPFPHMFYQFSQTTLRVGFCP